MIATRRNAPLPPIAGAFTLAGVIPERTRYLALPAVRPHHAALGLLLLATVAGANWLSFQCDDAYINYRYVRNLYDGIGLVWNPPPFQPVEGYGALLWILLLCATWHVFGVEPPEAANVLSISLGVCQFLLVAATAMRLQRRDGSPAAVAIGVLTVTAIAGNRTFLQWMTSGLETALFNLAFLGWVLLAFRVRERRTTGWLVAWSAAAAAAALTRPDGLLLGTATIAAAVLVRLRGERTWREVAIGLLPLLAIVAHTTWRHGFYGEWLPNTYYAKVVGSWPEAGMRYFACFALEHGVWLWVPLALVWLVHEVRRQGANLVSSLLRHAPAVVAVTTVLAHAGYYLLVVGGDHFEYRVLSQLVPMGFLSAAAMLVRVCRGDRAPMLWIAALWLASGIGWVHLAWTSDMTRHGFRPVAAKAPAFAQPLARWFDRQQAWLRYRNIGLRCNHHRMILAGFGERFRADMPREGSVDPFPTFLAGAVGLVGWRLHDTVVIDTYGLNDWVVARTPPTTTTPLPRDQLRPLLVAADQDHDQHLDTAELRQALVQVGTEPEYAEYLASVLVTSYATTRLDALPLAVAENLGEWLAGERSMAHDRHPPPGYVEAFEPNVVVSDGRVLVTPRAQPMTAERIRAIEAEWRTKMRSGRLR